MTTTLPLHLKDLEHRAAVLHLALDGLRAAWAKSQVAIVDFDCVLYAAEKLRRHIEGLRVECEYNQGGH
jgi:hypothetical protein